ncbi:MAG: hypothetical protein AAB787_02530 [Patescibacteria group bacterium]
MAKDPEDQERDDIEDDDVKLDFNKTLRSMCWRLGGSIVKNGARFGNSHFHEVFEQELKRLTERFEREGKKIVPAAELPKNKGKKYEPDGVISLGHVRNMAMRKMIKLFLSCLWQVWREAEGLPVTVPYSIGIQRHDESHLIKPWDMVDKEAKRPRKKAA